MRHAISALLLIAALYLMGGCGQMGPLYMPPQETQPTPPAEQADKSPQPPGAP